MHVCTKKKNIPVGHFLMLVRDDLNEPIAARENVYHVYDNPKNAHHSKHEGWQPQPLHVCVCVCVLVCVCGCATVYVCACVRGCVGAWVRGCMGA